MGEHKTLILKVGYSEVLAGEGDSRKASMGDVIRATPILHAFKEDHVTWVTDEKARPLVEGNPYIDRILNYDFTTAMRLQVEQFDTVVNLEKVPGICAIADNVHAWRKYGFRLDPRTGEAEAYDKSYEALSISSSPETKRKNKRLFQELLFEMIGKEWKGEEYVLGYQPTTTEKYDVAMTVNVGDKWPSKRWPVENWDCLEKRLVERGLKVTRQDKQGQEILTSLYAYTDWLNSSRLVIGPDSLGLHLSLALKKKVLGLFGPTPDKEVYFYDLGKAILPTPTPDCRPCSEGICSREVNCIESISPEVVYNEAIAALKL